MFAQVDNTVVKSPCVEDSSCLPLCRSCVSCLVSHVSMSLFYKIIKFDFIVLELLQLHCLHLFFHSPFCLHFVFTFFPSHLSIFTMTLPVFPSLSVFTMFSPVFQPPFCFHCVFTCISTHLYIFTVFNWFFSLPIMSSLCLHIPSFIFPSEFRAILLDILFWVS